METWHTAPAPPSTAHVPAVPSAGGLDGRFQGIFISRSASPQVPVAPAKVSPAPKNAARARNQLLTNATERHAREDHQPRDELDLSVDGQALSPLPHGQIAPGARHSSRPRSRACGDRHDRAPRRRWSRARRCGTPRITGVRLGISSRRALSSSRGMLRAPSMRSPSNSSRLRTSRRNGTGRRVRSILGLAGGDASRVGLAEVVAENRRHVGG